MRVTHTAIVLAWQGERGPSVRRLETLVKGVVARKRAKALVWQREREQEVLVFFAPDEANPVDSGLVLAQEFLYPGVPPVQWRARRRRPWTDGARSQLLAQQLSRRPPGA